MYIWTRGALRAVDVGQPSPFLTFVAGEFAERIASLWPAPHAAFLTTPAERRHLVCIALAVGEPERLPADALLERSLKAAIRLALPNAPAGLARALGRLGETAWPAEDYLTLLGQLRFVRTAKFLRHADTISTDTVRTFARLPARLLDRIGIPLEISPAAAELLVECLQVIDGRGADYAEAALDRWAKASTVDALFELVRQDIIHEFPQPPIDCGPRFRRLACIADLNDVATRYENCVRNYVEPAADGRVLLYEWLGEPGAVVELCRDIVYGWMLSEARLAGNKPVEMAMRDEIASELVRRGVHVGRSYWDLDDALGDAARRRRFIFPPVDEVVQRLFGA